MRRGCGGGSSAPSAASQYSAPSELRAVRPRRLASPLPRVADGDAGPAREVLRGHRPAAGGEARRDERRATRSRESSRACARGAQSSSRTNVCCLPCIGPRQMSPSWASRKRMWYPWPRPVSMPSLSSRSITSGRLSRRSPPSAPLSNSRAALDVGRLEPDLRAASLVGGEQARAAERQQPAHVLGRREMDRPAHQPGAHDLAIGDGALDTRSRGVA